MVQITPEALTELQFWLYNIHKYNGQNILHSPAAVRLVHSDASSTGYGGYTVQHGLQVAHELWSEENALQSSNWSELCGVHWILETLVVKLKGERLRWFSDNQNVVRTLMTGS